MKWMAAAALLVLSAPAFAQGAPPGDAAVMTALYSHLSNAFTGGALRVGHDRDFLVLGNPGFVVSPDHLKKGASQESLSAFMDRVPSVSSSPLWCQPLPANGTNAVSGVYQDVLNNSDLWSEGKTKGDDAATESDPNILDRAGVTDYYAMKANYDQWTDAVSAAETEFLASGGSVNGALGSSWHTAYANFMLPKTQTATLSLDNSVSQTIDPTWWPKIRKIAAGKTVPLNEVTFYPSPDAWNSDEGWIHVTLDASSVQLERFAACVQTPLPAAFTFWSVDAANGKAPAFSNNYSITMDVKAVSAVHPYLRTAVFTARTWRWNDLTKNPLSDGNDPRLGQVPKGDLPLIPTGLLLARKVVIQNGEGNFGELVRNLGDISWGPFVFKTGIGSVRAVSNQKNKLMIDDNGRSPTVEVIGVFCEVVPKSPDPDPALGWTPEPGKPSP